MRDKRTRQGEKIKQRETNGLTFAVPEKVADALMVHGGAVGVEARELVEKQVRAWAEEPGDAKGRPGVGGPASKTRARAKHQLAPGPP